MKVWALKLISCTFAALLALSECRAGYQYIGSHGFSSHHQKFSKYQFPEDDTRAAGETCTPYIGRCESGLTCHPDAVTEHTWKCKKALPLGSFCINDTKEFCDGTNAVCRESKCTIVSPIGAQCGKANTLCGEGLTCTSFIPRLSDKICAKVSPRTAQCGRSKFEFCARGLQCVAAQNVCFRPPPQPFSNFHALNQRMTHKELKFDSQCGPNSTQHRTYSGYCNNKGHPEWGSADTVFHSLLKDVPLRENLPNARVISNIICADQGDLKNKRGLTTLFTFFGQFIDHTFTFIDVTEEADNIKITNDFEFGDGSIPFFRTKKRNGKPINFMSSYIDGAMVYGRTLDINANLRAKSGGKLLLMDDNNLPLDEHGQYKAGDSRANENIVLLSLHTLFVREHNRVCVEISARFSDMSDDDIYQLARNIVIAEIQAICYYEWLPAIGMRLGPYLGYNPEIHGTITNEFSTVAFRVGHTLVAPKVTIMDAGGSVSQLSLRESFFNPEQYRESTLDKIVRGAAHARAAEVDAQVTDELRNHLVGEDGTGGNLDLIALNIQRARDHGVSSYNEMRRAYGLRPVRSFFEIAHDETLAKYLASVYQTVDDVDSWVGGACEPHLPFSSLGETFHAIWKRQFKALREGDRFYFEKPGLFDPSHIKQIPTLNHLLGSRSKIGYVLKSIIISNSNIKHYQLPPNIFRHS